MFDLPKSCFVNKFIPKKTFYEKISVATSVKEEFIDLVDKIVWAYKISPDTLGANKTEKVEEIEVFEVILKGKKLPKSVIKTIVKGIPYPILFIIKHDDDFCYSISVTDTYFSEWNEDIEIEFKGINLEYIYEKIVKAIIKEQDNEKQFDEIINDNSKKNLLLKQIEHLKNKIKQEKQFNRKVELNQELRKLENEMEEMQNG